MKTIVVAIALLFSASSLTHAGNTPPYNEKCPVCGKDAKLIFHADYKGKRIIFASGDCIKKFNSSPGKYKIVPKETDK